MSGGVEVGEAEVEYPTGKELARLPERAWQDEIVRSVTQEVLATGKAFILGGDLNVVPTERDIYDHRQYASQGGLSPTERKGFQHLLRCGLTDVMRAWNPLARIYTFYSYQEYNARRRNAGWRLNLRGVRWRV